MKNIVILFVVLSFVSVLAADLEFEQSSEKGPKCGKGRCAVDKGICCANSGYCCPRSYSCTTDKPPRCAPQNSSTHIPASVANAFSKGFDSIQAELKNLIEKERLALRHITQMKNSESSESSSKSSSESSGLAGFNAAGVHATNAIPSSVRMVEYAELKQKLDALKVPASHAFSEDVERALQFLNARLAKLQSGTTYNEQYKLAHTYLMFSPLNPNRDAHRSYTSCTEPCTSHSLLFGTSTSTSTDEVIVPTSQGTSTIQVAPSLSS